jgi:hypothetical protein
LKGLRRVVRDEGELPRAHQEEALAARIPSTQERAEEEKEAEGEGEEG